MKLLTLSFIILICQVTEGQVAFYTFKKVTIPRTNGVELKKPQVIDAGKGHFLLTMDAKKLLINVLFGNDIIESFHLTSEVSHKANRSVYTALDKEGKPVDIVFLEPAHFYECDALLVAKWKMYTYEYHLFKSE